MHSYHGERVSVAEPQEDTFQTLTAESRSEQNKMHYLVRSVKQIQIPVFTFLHFFLFTSPPEME